MEGDVDPANAFLIWRDMDYKFYCSRVCLKDCTDASELLAVGRVQAAARSLQLRGVIKAFSIDVETVFGSVLSRAALIEADGTNYSAQEILEHLCLQMFLAQQPPGFLDRPKESYLTAFNRVAQQEVRRAAVQDEGLFAG